MRLLSRARVAIAVLMGQALVLPAVAGAIPVTFEFRGNITYAGSAYDPPLAIGDPFTAFLSYDTDMPRSASVFGISYYDDGFVFEIHAGAHTWTTPAGMLVWEDGSQFIVGSTTFGTGLLHLEGPGVIPAGGGLPASLDLSRATVRHEVRGLHHTPAPFSPSQIMIAEITAIGPPQTLAPLPEPAPLTLSALGLAALAAARRRRRTR